MVVLPSIAIAHQVLETDRTPFSLPLPGLCRRVLHPLRYSQYCRFFSLSTTRLRTHSLSQSMHLAGEYQKRSFSVRRSSNCGNRPFPAGLYSRPPGSLYAPPQHMCRRDRPSVPDRGYRLFVALQDRGYARSWIRTAERSPTEMLSE